jgi:phosphomethylpyrimidine synthase
MADINSKLEMPVTTGPLPGSRKIHVAGTIHPDIRVAMREVALDPSANEPPVRIYDSSGPYTDDNAVIDIAAGLPPLRTAWIEARGDVERYPGREVKPEDAAARQGRCCRHPDRLCPPRHHHAGNGICRHPRKHWPGPA